MTDYQDTGSREKPNPYSATGADMYVCQDCGVPEGQPCRWIAKDGVGIAGSTRHFPHESRWRR